MNPLAPKTLAGIRRVVQNHLGGIQDGALIDEVVNDVHAAYLAGKVDPAYLLREAKLRATDRYRAEMAIKAREVIAAAGQAEALSYRQGKDGDNGVGGDGQVEVVVDLDPGRLAPKVDPTVTKVVSLATPGRDRRVRVYRGKTMSNPGRNEDLLVARLDAQRVRDQVGDVRWGEVADVLDPSRGRPDMAARQRALDALAAAGVDLVSLGRPSRRVRRDNRAAASNNYRGETPPKAVTMTTQTQIDHARRVLQDRTTRLLMAVLPLPPEWEPAVRGWAGAVGLRDVVEFDADDVPHVSLVAVPLFLLDYALAMIRREHGLTEEQAVAEADEIAPMVREDWPKVFSGGAPVDYRTYSVEIDGGAEVKFDVVGQAMDYVESWLARQSA